MVSVGSGRSIVRNIESRNMLDVEKLTLSQSSPIFASSCVSSDCCAEAIIFRASGRTPAFSFGGAASFAFFSRSTRDALSFSHSVRRSTQTDWPGRKPLRRRRPGCRLGGQPTRRWPRAARRRTDGQNSTRLVARLRWCAWSFFWRAASKTGRLSAGGAKQTLKRMSCSGIPGYLTHLSAWPTAFSTPQRCGYTPCVAHMYHVPSLTPRLSVSQPLAI